MMKYIKLGLISVAFLSMLVFIISFLMPSSVIVSRAIDISAPSDSIYMMVHNFSKWNQWLENYDSSKASFTANAGKGAQLKLDNTVVVITETSPQLIKTTWQVGKSAPLPANFEFISHDSSFVTTVHWQFNQKIRWYPWEKFAAIFSEKALGPFMEKSLERLKQNSEHTNQ